MMLAVIIVLAILLIFAVVLMVVTQITLKKSFGRRGAEKTGFLIYFLCQNPKLRAMEFSCPTKSGAVLRGIQLIPDGAAKGLIVLTHGFGRSLENYLPEAKCFVERNYQVLMFDGLGTGQSDGKAIRGLPQHVLDMASVLDQVVADDNIPRLPLFLFGHSWGGYAANAVSCLKEYPIRGVISVSAFNDPIATLRPSVVRRFGKATPFLFWAVSLHQRLTFGKLETYTSAKGLAKLSCPVLVCHSKDDPVVPYSEHFEQIQYALAQRPNVQFAAMDRRKHNLTTPPYVDQCQRQLIKLMRSNPERVLVRTKQLWELQLQTDVDLINHFADFYDRCLEQKN